MVTEENELGTASVAPRLFFVAPQRSAEPSLMDRLTADERRELFAWSDAQPRIGGGINLMQWPGWVAVAERHMRTRSTS